MIEFLIVLETAVLVYQFYDNW